VHYVAAATAGLAVYFFVFWMSAALLPLRAAPWVSSVLAVALAILAARFVGARARSRSGNGLLRSAARGAILTGAIGFVLGFFGPMIFTPGANQGPLLGLFITGPLGFLLGAIGGAIRWAVTDRRRPAVRE